MRRETTAVLTRLLDRLRAFGQADAPVPLFTAAYALMVAVHLLRPIHDVDLFWQVRLGQIVLDTGTIPEKEPFLANRQHEPLAVVAWLGQTIFAVLQRTTGWVGLAIFDMTIWIISYFLVVRRCWKPGENTFAPVAAILLAWYAAVPFASIRPQTFSLVLFALLWCLLQSGRSARWRIILGAWLFLIWQNLHPSVVMGIALILTYLVGLLIDSWRRGQPLFQQSLLVPLVLLPIAAIATIATPAGTDIFRISALNTERSLQMQIGEWLPLWRIDPPEGRLQAVPVMLIVLGIAFVGRRRVPAAQLVPFLAFTLLTLFMFRFVIYWSILAVPVVAGALQTLDFTRPHPARRWTHIALTFGIIILLNVIPPRFAPMFPFAGIDALGESPAQGTIVNHHYFGGMLVYYAPGRWQPTTDGRYYLFSETELKHYRELHSGRRRLADWLADLPFRPAGFFLCPGEDDELILQLIDARWELIHSDATSAVFLPPGPPHGIVPILPK
ncbi:MAG: hypothetical protein ACRCZF_02590 [Gemmataceae bacterium]